MCSLNIHAVRVAAIWLLVLPVHAEADAASWLKNTIGLSPGGEMVAIPGGTFNMGSPRFEKGHDDDETLHKVTVERFLLAKREVTVAEFRAFVEATGYETDAERNEGGNKGCYSENPAFGSKSWEKAFAWVAGRSWRDPGFEQEEDHPVACVSWNDAMAYIEWLRLETEKPWRLPTEAEWEFAARGGEKAARFWGKNADEACGFANVFDRNNLDRARYKWRNHNCADGFDYTAPVGSFKPNPYGLRDMLGNVWEWTCSWYLPYDENNTGGAETRCGSAGQPGLKWLGVDKRVLRGGSWLNEPACVRSSDRGGVRPSGRGKRCRLPLGPGQMT